MRRLFIFVLASALTWCFGTAQAEEVCVDGDTAIGIKGLDYVTDEYGPVTINVDFRYATGFEVYGSGLNFPFHNENAEEDGLVTMAAINNALGTNNPIPGSAGRPDQNVYFIGLEEESEGGAALVAALGSENLTGGFWDACSRTNDCVAGAAVLEADRYFTYADLSWADGSKCGNAPPTEPPPAGSFNIIPCITGSWFLPERDGEGYNIEIIGSELDPDLLAYFYTYDDAGNQMWLVGAGEVNGDTAVVPVEVLSGPSYGDDYDKDDLDREDWGTLTFTFTSKDAGTVKRASTIGFGTTTEDIIRLTSATGLECP